MSSLPSGIFNVSYAQDRQIFRTPVLRISMALFLVLLFTAPLYLNDYLLS